MGPADSLFKYSNTGWNPIFALRREAIYPKETNVAVFDAFGASNLLTTKEIIDRFLNYKCDGDTDRYLYRDLQISNSLRGLDIECLRRGSFSGVSTPLVLMDDRNNIPSSASTPAGNCRLTRGPLNAHQFYVELCKSRFQDKNPKEPNAERRLIYITDGDPYCVLALLATASTLQAVALRDFLERNTASSAFIGAEVPSKGFPAFSLEFHLPYYAWRRTRTISNSPSQSRIRNFHQVMYLDDRHNMQLSDGLIDHLFEAQISILITGLDHSFWTVYCFADVYFKGQDHVDSVDYYYQERLDPTSGGKSFLSSPEWDPRMYFLIVLACRVEQVREEWKNVVAELLRQIKPCTHEMFVKSNKADLTQEESYKWVIETLRKYTILLSKTTETWETFKTGDIRYFYEPGSHILAQPSFGDYLTTIEKEFKKLKELRRSLEHQTEIFEKMANSLTTQAALAENRALRQQSYFLQALAIITICYLPLNLASSIYSMQSSIFPEAVTLSDYLHTILGLTFATLLVVICLPPIIKLWSLLRKGQAYIYRWLLPLLVACVTRTFTARRLSERTDEERLEMDDWNTTARRTQ